MRHNTTRAVLAFTVVFWVALLSACAETAVQTPSAPTSAVNGLSTVADVRRDPANGTVTFAKAADLGRDLHREPAYASLVARDAYAEVALYVLSAYRRDIKLFDPESELVLEKLSSDNLGFHQARFKQVYQGVPVLDCGLIVQFDRTGRPQLLQGRYSPTPNLTSVVPALSETAAIAIARDLTDRPSASVTAQLVVFASSAGSSRLAYVFDLNRGRIDGLSLVVDAITGQELTRRPTSYEVK